MTIITAKQQTKFEEIVTELAQDKRWTRQRAIEYIVEVYELTPDSL